MFGNFIDSIKNFTLSGLKAKSRLIDVYDGDTVTCIFPIFGENYFKFNLRLMHIDTPEMKGDNPFVKQKALQARHRILSYCCSNYNLPENCSRNQIQEYLKNNEENIMIECYDFDKYGRILADIYRIDDHSVSVSELLLNEKLAVRYEGGTKKAI
jgi:endonuclease YncB( thermonuclease family)